VLPAKVTVWKPVFLVDVTPPEQRTSGLKDKADGPMVTVAREAIAASDAHSNRIQLSMKDSATHEMSKDGKANDSSAEHSLQALDANPPNQETLRASAMNTRELLHYRGPDWLENKIELHRRFALPLACFVLAMLGIPIGVTTRKGGKSAAYVNAIFLAFFCYYLSFITLVGFAKQRAMPVEVALWLPNEVLALAGLVFLYRMELAGDRDLLTFWRGFTGGVWSALKSTTAREEKKEASSFRFFLLPQLVDTYVLQSFFFYLAMLLASFVSLALIFNFFELMGDMVKHSNLTTALKYLFFLTPSLIYTLTPPSVLVAVLLTLGVLSKQNEITAFKACGVSLYRLAMPLLATSMVLSGLLFAFNYYYVPAANLIQNRLRNQIKDRKVESWLRADRKWTLGYDSRIYYYRYFDPTEKAMVEVNVFDLDPASFRLKREIVAAKAQWDPVLNTWVFHDGWSTSFQGAFSKDYSAFHGQLEPRSFANLKERPEYFLKEATQDSQMNFFQLEQYIADLARSGFNTTKLQVQFHLKFSVPILCFVMALIAIPFGFMVGNRGAMTGIGVSFGVAVSYLAIGKFSEKLGDVSLLPPAMAAWAPDMAFALVGLYLYMRMRS
jgi:LPS export ABC transporter permease LptG